MNLFWRVPIPFAITYLSGGLICEHIQKRKADEYANKVVRRYKPDESPYSFQVDCTLEEALESLDDTLNKFEKQKPDG
jgi:hypothetical protein